MWRNLEDPIASTKAHLLEGLGSFQVVCSKEQEYKREALTGKPKLGAAFPLEVTANSQRQVRRVETWLQYL